MTEKRVECKVCIQSLALYKEVTYSVRWMVTTQFWQRKHSYNVILILQCWTHGNTQRWRWVLGFTKHLNSINVKVVIVAILLRWSLDWLLSHLSRGWVNHLPTNGKWLASPVLYTFLSAKCKRRRVSTQATHMQRKGKQRIRRAKVTWPHSKDWIWHYSVCVCHKPSLLPTPPSTPNSHSRVNGPITVNCENIIMLCRTIDFRLKAAGCVCFDTDQPHKGYVNQTIPLPQCRTVDKFGCIREKHAKGKKSLRHPSLLQSLF